MAEIIDGKAISKQIQEEVQADVAKLLSSRGIVPGLTVIIVGEDPASKTYVSNKAKVSAKLGMNSNIVALSETTDEADVIRVVEQLNNDPSVHGILVQLPLPKHIDANRVLYRINPSKDVDGLHPYNIGLLCTGEPQFIPCTPFGICELLLRSKISPKGKEVVVIGRSNLVGRPISVLLSSKADYGDATVTLCHSRSTDLPSVCCRADIMVVAAGQPCFVTGKMIKPGAVVIDVGIHPGASIDGKMCGDVEFESASRVASLITPVPGGVGPMTIAMLMRNTLSAAERTAVS